MSTTRITKHLSVLDKATDKLERSALKADDLEMEERVLLQKALQEDNMEDAKSHAENSIKHKNFALYYRHTSPRVDAVVSRMKEAASRNQVTESMAGVVKSMALAMKNMDLENLSNFMDRFEQEFIENFDEQSQAMGDTLRESTLTVPQTQVYCLMQEVADEAGLHLNMQMLKGRTSYVRPLSAASHWEDFSLI